VRQFVKEPRAWLAVYRSILIWLIVMPLAMLRLKFTCTTLSLTHLLTSPRCPASAESLRRSSSASTRKRSLVGVDRHPPNRLLKEQTLLSLEEQILFTRIHQSVRQRLVPPMVSLEQRILFTQIHQSVRQRLVPHRVRQVRLEVPPRHQPILPVPVPPSRRP
jgi:hypothetical protein